MTVPTTWSWSFWTPAVVVDEEDGQDAGHDVVLGDEIFLGDEDDEIVVAGDYEAVVLDDELAVLVVRSAVVDSRRSDGLWYIARTDISAPPTARVRYHPPPEAPRSAFLSQRRLPRSRGRRT